MMRSLRARLFAAHVVVVAIALATVVVLAAREERAWIVARNTEELARAGRLALRELEDEGGTPRDWPAEAGRLGRALGFRVTLIDGHGRVLGDSEVARDRLARLENHAGRPEVRAALQGRVGSAQRHSASIDVDLLYVAQPARVGPVAVLRLAEPLTDVTRATRSLVRIVALAALVTLFAMAMVVAWLTTRHARRIAELEGVARRLGQGNTDVRAREQPSDEVGRLGRAINRMSAELESRLLALQRERDQRERILVHMTDGVALIDANGDVVHANRGLAAIFGIVPPSPGQSIRELTRSPDIDELIQSARNRSQTVEVDLRLWTPRPRLVRATATGLPGERGAVLLVLHDLTELERLHRVRQEFVANVSHELKTPLTSVRGYAETLLEGGLEDPENREGFVRIIRDQAARLEGLVDDLLSLAELERRDARLVSQRFDLREALERQVTVARGRAVRSGLTLGIEPGAAVEVAADRGRLEQVIANLLDNAIKYTDHGGIVARAGANGTQAWIEIEDSGMGIPEADQERVFERFYRVDKGRSRDRGGTGLGLAIVKHIVELHGGKVTLRSAPGRGSTFRVELPRDAGRETIPDA